MNSIDTTLRILWLSDIHYKSEYNQKNDVFEKYLEGFCKKCEEINADSKIDYILLSGDIAQSGTVEDYALFNSDILIPLQELLPDARLLVIPGNHDVYRKAGTFLNEFIQSLGNRAEFFAQRYKDFEKVFTNYTEAFKDNIALCSNSSPNYKRNLLQGYLIDHKKKTFFILINSSWYSFDRLFLEEYLRYHGIEGRNEKLEFAKVWKYNIKKLVHFFAVRCGISKETNEKKVQKNIVKDIQQIANEYGNQIIGLDSYQEFSNLRKDLEYYSDYLVVSTMHHPANWLSWDERINYDEAGKENRFDLIKKKTDLLLTGHEHVPKSHASEYLNDRRLLHIQAGCFLTAQQSKDFQVQGNWFSVLNININKRVVVNEKYAFNTEGNIWEVDKDYLTPKKLNKKYYIKLVNQRRSLIKESVSELLHKEELLDKLLDKKLVKKGLFYIDENRIYKLIENFDDLKPKMLLEALNNQDNVEFVYLVFVDLYYEEKEEYSSGKDKLLVLQNIKLKIDFQFNKFRHDFFSNLSKDDAVKFKNLKIANIVVPYWECESIVN